jgi:GH24 family phage-related lysozyme (muramidase)
MINDHLLLSNKGVALLKGIEALRINPYDDQTGKTINKWCKGATIGYGHLILSHEWENYKNGITVQQANNLLLYDIAPFERAIKKVIIVPLSQNQFDALVILAFNIGANAFTKSSVAKMVNDPSAVTRYPTLESAWRAWNKSQGVPLQGLLNRRNAELDIYKKGVYKRW